MEGLVRVADESSHPPIRRAYRQQGNSRKSIFWAPATHGESDLGTLRVNLQA